MDLAQQLNSTRDLRNGSLDAVNIQRQFREAGITITVWAAKRGHNPSLVHMILRGERKCLRGKSYQIARELKTM